MCHASVEQDGDALQALRSPEEPLELLLERGGAPLPRQEFGHVGECCYACVPRRCCAAKSSMEA